ncbi:hypothetical protein STEG23_024593, partial [Scotinomys teguina]
MKMGSATILCEEQREGRDCPGRSGAVGTSWGGTSEGEARLLDYIPKLARRPGLDMEGQRKREYHESTKARWRPENPVCKGSESASPRHITDCNYHM